MKKLLNFSKLAISTLIMSSLFMACSEEITENTVDTPYTANTGNIKTAGQAVDLGLPSGTKWANMNVGATSESDNGILFVWGDVTGNQVLASSVDTYTDVTDPKAVSDLFKMFKESKEKIGYLYDTVNVYKESFKPLISHVEFSEIDDIIRAKFDAFKEGKRGKLMAVVTSGTDILCLCDSSLRSGSKYYHKNNPNLTDIEIKDEDGYDLVINLIDSTEVKFFENNASANNYANIPNLFNEKDGNGNPLVVRQDYTGGDIGDDVKDRHDDKKKNNLKFVPVYSIISNAKHDPATANWGNGWRMPSSADFVELLEYCNWEFTGSGYKVSSKVNGNSIFLPAAGYRYGEQWYGNGNAGYYATGEITGTYHFPSMEDQFNGSKGAVNGNENMPNMLIFQHGQYNSLDMYHNLSTSFGVSVRPVKK